MQAIVAFILSLSGYCFLALPLPAVASSQAKSPGTKLTPLLIKDVTRLNPIRVAEVLPPDTTEAIQIAVQTHRGPISVGGPSSMGANSKRRDAAA
jgi:hypothetical protein